MVCSKCGNFNESKQNFCRFCGAALTQKQTKTQAPPRPHSWASPSSPLHAVAGFDEPQQVQPLVHIPPPMPHPKPSAFRCPHCGTNAPPQINKKISTGGWIVFAAMLLFCFPLFWIGLLIKDEERVCSMCFIKLG
jgi:hypothetical protein